MRPRRNLNTRPTVERALIRCTREGESSARGVGHRSYLVARQPARSETTLDFRMDRIYAAEILEQSFALAPGFALEQYATQAFKIYQDSAQYGEVI